ALQYIHGWSASTVSAPITAYYVAGALLTAAIAGVYERFGPRVVVAGGAVCMAASIAALGGVGRPWQLYPVFLVMSVGWGAMSGAAINIILAPWFQRRRGLAVSLAFNGATLGGVIVVPALIALVGWLGLAAQVGVLTHLVALVTPALGAGGAARAVSLTTAAALVGRLATGFAVDKLNRRLVASATLIVQLAGLALLAREPSAASVYAGCILFGLGVG